jgi:hypothetical protein
MIPSFVSMTTVRNQVYFLLLMSLMTFMSCQEPIVVGSDLLSEELINIEKIDNLPLSSYTKETGRILTFSQNVNSRTYMTGQLLDPVFGVFNAEIYFTNYLLTSKPDFTDATLDSMDFKFLLDTLGSFGSVNGVYKFELFQLEKQLVYKDTVFSDINYPLSTLIGSVTTQVKPKDSISVIDHVTKKTLRFPPHVRIPINKDWAEALFKNKEANGTDTLFTKYIKGYYLKATPIIGDGVIGFNFADAALTSANQLNKLNVYYNKLVKDTIQKLSYQYPIQGNTYNNFKHIRTGSTSENYIGDTIKGNEISFLQGAAGLKTAIKFDNLTSLKGKKIVKAEIDVYVGNIPGYNSVIKEPSQLIATRVTPEGKTVAIEDILQLVNVNSSFYAVFGGALENNQGVKKYTINITNHIKDYLEYGNFNPEIFLGIAAEAENAYHAILYGAKHPIYPMKLRITVAK